jgi:recombinational DNA repair protein RecR
MSRWDALRNKTKGEAGTIPTCSKCRKVSVLDPCRACATPTQAARYPEAPTAISEKELT